ncbi:MAG: NADH-quinone oxidoreductase subunit N [Phycisphaeraceae bacterium]|nr:NADH-quinone oxidoreductase subunit N [Phycisphaeraceae bacterium]
MDATLEKLQHLWPEITMLIGACACLIAGLSSHKAVRKATPMVAVGTLAAAAIVLLSIGTVEAKHFLGLGSFAAYLKLAVCGMGILLVFVATGTVDKIKQVMDAEAKDGKAFNPGDDYKAEFFAFMLFSLTGVMMTAGASELVWLFLALELTSLPTYVMVATSRDRDKGLAQESAVKYFFLGALSAAVFLYGFTLIYGATGHTEFAKIAAYVGENGASPMMVIGVALGVVGVCFKIAAVPMHFYTADVYQGAATPVTAFLAFVPKAAGMIALIALLGLPLSDAHASAGDLPSLPGALVYLVAILAAVTMTVGNALGLVQTNLKRVLAYSSIAHSGYMLVGVLVGPMLAMELMKDNPEADTSLSNGTAAVLFYLIAYGLSTIGAFAVLGCLTRRDGGEVETYDDLAGMRTRHPFQAGVLLVSVISLVGLPPLVGFLGKLYLIGSAFSAGTSGSGYAGLYQGLVVLLIINSAMSAGYYLRIVGVAFFGEDQGQTVETAPPLRRAGGVVAALASIALGGYPSAGFLASQAKDAAEPVDQPDQVEAAAINGPASDA